MTLLTVLFVLFAGFTSGSQTARNLLARQATQLVGSISGQIRSHLSAARNHAEFMAARLETEAHLIRGTPEQIMAAMADSMAAAPQLASTVFVDPQFQALDVDRTSGGLSLHRRDWSADERVIEAMPQIERASGGFWGEPVFIPQHNDTVLNYRVPVRRQGQLVGALSTWITTAEIAQYLTRITRAYGATAFVLVGPDEVLAYSDSDPRTLARSVHAPLTPLSNIPDPVLRNIWNEATTANFSEFEPLPQYQFRILTWEDEDYVVVFEYLYGVGPIPWIVGCYFRAEDFTEAFDRIHSAAVTAFGALLIALVAVFFVGRRLARPILKLAEAASLVGGAGPRSAPILPPSRLREIATATEGFNDMVSGLRERESLRETFGKFVPDAVADAIVADGGTLEPQSRLTTTLFTDIVGFSTVAENMKPEDLISMLNEYFSALVEIIEAHRGVIHQFQGDAILATFNLPMPHEDHASLAVRAALAIQDVTRSMQFAGHALPTRVGINTGMAVCGTVGGEGRLGFTVHGDEVNLGARIEQLNKEYGTRVLVAGSTVALCGHDLRFEKIDEVPIRGRSQRAVLYRVLGPHNADENWNASTHAKSD